jgi:hypothetical protein
VRVATGMFASFFCVTFILTYFYWTELDEEVCHLRQ